MQDVIKRLQDKFNAKYLAETMSFPGIKIERFSDHLKLTQSELITKLLERFRMKDAKISNVPIIKGYQYDNGEILDVPYRKLMEGHMYISIKTRPDISYATSCLSQYLDKPTKSCWNEAKRVLRYLNGTVDVL